MYRQCHGASASPVAGLQACPGQHRPCARLPASGPGKELLTVSRGQSTEAGLAGPGVPTPVLSWSPGTMGGHPCVVSTCGISHPPSGLSRGHWDGGRVWRTGEGHRHPPRRPGVEGLQLPGQFSQRSASPTCGHPSVPQGCSHPCPRGLSFQPRLLLAPEGSTGQNRRGAVPGGSVTPL